MYAGIFIKHHLNEREIIELEKLEKLIMGITGNNAFTLQPIAHYGAVFTLEISGAKEFADAKVPIETINLSNNDTLSKKLEKLLKNNISIIAAAQYLPSFRNHSHAHLFAFYTITQIRGTGISGLFMKRCEKYLLEAYKIKNIDLTVSKDNIAAVKFYQKNGFTETTEKDNFYGSGISRLILGKTINSGTDDK